MKLKEILLLFCIIGLNRNLFSQINSKRPFYSKADTLRGSITPQRAWWNLTYYDLNVNISPTTKEFIGYNVVYYEVLEPSQLMQIDMQYPMQISAAIQGNDTLEYYKIGKNAYFITLKKVQIVGAKESIKLIFGGKPKVAVRPPWDGGVQWTKDEKGLDFIATSCQELGSSVWWPCKDHMYDEPDSMQISVTIPNGLTNVSNGRLRKAIKNDDKTSTFVWFVANPINNYGVNINIGNYLNWEEKFDGEKGNLDLNYYALATDYDKAKTQFKQVPLMLKAFEHWFGPYPFYEDGYKLVQVPYLGMEHQSSVTYGNKFANGYLGKDMSGSGWGLLWDYIIIHESGHEWFANNITYKDIADMWIHESFTDYSETLFVEYYYGKKAANEYVTGLRKIIRNDATIIGNYDVNQSGSGDMYAKGANMLHTIRQIANNDDLWRDILRGLNKTFYHQTVTTAQIEKFMDERIGADLAPVFDQYLRNITVPIFEYRWKGKTLEYRWANCISNFAMPIKIDLKQNSMIWLEPSTQWKKYKATKKTELTVDSNFYVNHKKVK